MSASARRDWRRLLVLVSVKRNGRTQNPWQPVDRVSARTPHQRRQRTYPDSAVSRRAFSAFCQQQERRTAHGLEQACFCCSLSCHAIGQSGKRSPARPLRACRRRDSRCPETCTDTLYSAQAEYRTLRPAQTRASPRQLPRDPDWGFTNCPAGFSI